MEVSKMENFKIDRVLYMRVDTATKIYFTQITKCPNFGEQNLYELFESL